jgi:hypothetical protein
MIKRPIARDAAAGSRDDEKEQPLIYIRKFGKSSFDPPLSRNSGCKREIAAPWSPYIHEHRNA